MPVLTRLLKFKKLFIIIMTLLLVFIIYTVNADQTYTYVALGDSVALGQNPYGEINYGYTDYIANYLKKNDLLRSYTKGYAVSGYRTTDVINDINLGKTIDIDGEQVNIKKALREANLVTISIGANDFLQKLNVSSLDKKIPPLDNLKKIIDEIIPDIEKTLATVKRYAKGQIIVVGYYNPLPSLFKTNSTELDLLFAYAKEEYQKICNKYNVDYVDVYETMKKDADYLPNPFDIHPNTKGYEAISKEIISFLEKRL